MEILRKFNIKPRNKKIYEQAFLHSSYCNEKGLKDDYERLEFLGDAVLDLIISEYLYKSYSLKEGQMTKLRANYVCENALYEYALDLNFHQYIKVGKGEESSGGKYRKAILADTFEAFLGALYIDQGLNKVRSFINKVVIPKIESKEINYFVDYKSLLQEVVQTNQKALVYKILKQEGPSHNKKFTMAVFIGDIKYGVGRASSKKEAEQLAARDALNKRVQ